MTRSLVLFGVLAACSSRAQPVATAPQTVAATPAPPGDSAELATLIPDDATSVSAWRPTDFTLLSLIDAPPEMHRCWRNLEQKIDIAYQVFTATNGSLVILAGDLPRAQVQPCAEEALLDSQILTTEVTDEGGQLVAETKFGLVHAAWKGRYIVIGRPADVTRALAAKTPSKVWAAAVAELPITDARAPTAYVAVSHDPTFTGLVGVPTTQWVLSLQSPLHEWPAKTFIEEGDDALDRFAKEQERKAQGLPPPDAGVPPEPKNPTFVGRLDLQYASAADATRAADVFANNTFPFAMEPSLALALSKFPRKLAGATLTLEFTQDSFAGVELAKLEAWLARLQAAAH